MISKNQISALLFISLYFSIILTANAELGKDWTEATPNASWSERQAATTVAFNNGSGERMWLMGGFDGVSTPIADDVWSSLDGITWTLETLHAAWSPRQWHTSVVFDGRIWVLGGLGSIALNDVWSSVDGVNWTLATPNAGWSPRFNHTTVVYDNQIWVIGGSDRI